MPLKVSPQWEDFCILLLPFTEFRETTQVAPTASIKQEVIENSG
jgi:hypothetical protein